MEEGEVPILVGLAGVGKTTVVRNIAQKYERELVILTLSQMEPGDLIGLPVPDGERTRYLTPDWWPSSGNSIVFLDEINRSHPLVRSAVMQLLIDKRIHNHVLPEGTWIVAAMNPSDEGYEVSEIFDEAFIDRFVWIKVEADITDWEEYMNAKGYSEYAAVIRSIYTTNPKIFHKRSFSLPKIVPTPRAHERFAKLLEKFTDVIEDTETFEKIMIELGEGIIGKAAALVVSDYLKLHKVEVGKIFEDPEWFKSQPFPVRIKLIKAWVNDFVRRMEEGSVAEKAQELEKAAKVLKDIATREEILAFMKEFTFQPPEFLKRFKLIRSHMYDTGMDTFNSLFLDTLTAKGQRNIGEVIYETGGEVIS